MSTATARILTFARDDLTVQAALDTFVSAQDAKTTSRTYKQVLGQLARRIASPDDPTAADLSQHTLSSWTTESVSTAFAEVWPTPAPRYRNKLIAVVRSFLDYARGHGWPIGDVVLVADRARAPRDESKAIPLADLERLWERRKVPLRDRLLWLTLYWTGCRAEEILSANVEDLDQPNNRIRIVGKGGDTDWVYYTTPVARLLPRYLRVDVDGKPVVRTRGPLFLADRRPSPARMPAPVDLCDITGRGRLSYERAEYLFKQATGYTLHQLRHSRATHEAEAGRPTADLQALLRHKSARTTARYTILGEDARRRIAEQSDPGRRGR